MGCLKKKESCFQMLVKKLFSNAVFRVLNLVASIGIAFFMTPFVIAQLGDETYGLWILVSSIFSFYGVLDLGLSAATQRHIAQALAREDTAGANGAVVTSFVVFCGIGLIALLITVGIAAAGGMIVKDVSLVHDFRVVVICLGVSLALLFPSYAINGVYSANFKLDVSSQIHLVKLLVRFLLILIFLKMKFGIISMAVITMITDVAAGVAMIVIAGYLAPWLRWRFSAFDMRRLKEMFSFGASFLFVTLCERGRNALPAIAINSAAGLTNVTLFGVAQQIYEYFVQLLGNVFGVFLPLFVRRQSSAEHAENSRDFLFLTQLALSVSVVMATGVIASAPEFVSAWLGSRFLDSIAPLFILVVAGVFIAGFQAINQRIILLSCKTHCKKAHACHLNK